MKYIPLSLIDSTTNTKTATDCTGFPLGPSKHSGNDTRTADTTASLSDMPSRAYAASSQPTTMSRNTIALVPTVSPARPAPWANFKPVFTSSQTPKPAARSDSVKTTAAVLSIPQTPEYVKEAGAFYDLTQNIEQGSITLQPAAIDEVHKWNLGTATQRQIWALGKLAAVHARLRGEPDRFVRHVPVLALRGFWPVANNAITQAGLTTDRVRDVVVPVPSKDSIQALVLMLNWMCNIIYSEDCAFVKMPYINECPTYRNFRVAQMARMVGMTDVMQGMLGRINDLRYKGQLFRPDVEDVKLVMKYIAPDHGIRLRLVAMIAQAILDKKLRNKKDIYALMKVDTGFATEVKDAIGSEKKRRAEMKTS